MIAGHRPGAPVGLTLLGWAVAWRWPREPITVFGRAPALVVCLLIAGAAAADDALPIGIIDFYGLGSLSEERARAALTFKEGDSVSFAGEEPPSFVAASEARLAALPGVQSASVNLVCCNAGRVIAFVGVQVLGSRAISFRPAPTGNSRLADDIVQAGDEFSQALTAAGERGDLAEDRSQGHALNHDQAMRAAQDRFIVHASRDLPALRQVLRTSSRAEQRSLAAQVLGYAVDKAAVIEDLVHGMSDPAAEVRNSAMRALVVIGDMTPSAGRRVPTIPAAPFIALLDALRREAITPLAEIARWKSDGHAQPGYLVLARLARFTDDAALELWRRGERETVIRAALTSA